MLTDNAVLEELRDPNHSLPSSRGLRHVLFHQASNLRGGRSGGHHRKPI